MPRARSMYSIFVYVFFPSSTSLRIVSSDSIILSSLFIRSTESMFLDSAILRCITFFFASDILWRFSFSLYKYCSHLAHVDEHIKDFSRSVCNESFTSSLNSLIYDASYSFVKMSAFLDFSFSSKIFTNKLCRFRIYEVC